MVRISRVVDLVRLLNTLQSRYSILLYEAWLTIGAGAFPHQTRQQCVQRVRSIVLARLYPGSRYPSLPVSEIYSDSSVAQL